MITENIDIALLDKILDESIIAYKRGVPGHIIDGKFVPDHKGFQRPKTSHKVGDMQNQLNDIANVVEKDYGEDEIADDIRGDSLKLGRVRRHFSAGQD